MNTFLPYKDFAQVAKCLDYRRLGKQRVECKQLISGQWSNHPCSKMWKSYVPALKFYANCMIDEWIFRGYKNTISKYDIPEKIEFPDWLENPLIVTSHRANLLRKNYDYYSQFNWKIEPVDGYFWPLELNELGKNSKKHNEFWINWKEKNDVWLYKT